MRVRHVEKFPVGEYAEGLQWEIEYNGALSRDPSTLVCSHVVVDGDFLVLPRAVVAYNEAGFNKTILCAECVLQALVRPT